MRWERVWASNPRTWWLFGDSYNDVGALSVVGMPVAMGNAPDEIKAMARLVVADNDHDGIVEAMDRLF